MATELWLVRHGETDWNVEKRFQGQTDIFLNDTGRQQARILAEQLAGTAFKAVYSSDLRRAAETAQILAASVQLPVQFDRRLREIRHGEWEGKTFDPEKSLQMRGLYADPEHAHAPGGETLAQVAARTRIALDELAARHPGQRILVVAHGVSLAVSICQAENQPLTLAAQHLPENCKARVVFWPPATP